MSPEAICIIQEGKQTISVLLSSDTTMADFCSASHTDFAMADSTVLYIKITSFPSTTLNSILRCSLVKGKPNLQTWLQ